MSATHPTGPAPTGPAPTSVLPPQLPRSTVPGIQPALVPWPQGIWRLPLGRWPCVVECWAASSSSEASSTSPPCCQPTVPDFAKHPCGDPGLLGHDMPHPGGHWVRQDSPVDSGLCIRAPAATSPPHQPCWASKSLGPQRWLWREGGWVRLTCSSAEPHGHLPPGWRPDLPWACPLPGISQPSPSGASHPSHGSPDQHHGKC